MSTRFAISLSRSQGSSPFHRSIPLLVDSRGKPRCSIVNDAAVEAKIDAKTGINDSHGHPTHLIESPRQTIASPRKDPLKTHSRHR